ncbi:hypothetical protein NY547_11075 [Cnuibacter physcomitrellae]|uniref:hypothetical protein n=1 Tax=Cnuibacter physcomitrellae TaxID=1619308 RepID=UPI002175AEB0|nr:hypothetical protein [Cnuibacter physcomitrellae]MCS5497779.1 hypothetical protein [Cnuibacter physcomitrellae]
MDRTLLARADEIVASLSPGKRETVREIVINSVHRGAVDPSARRFLTAASGGPELADILTAALDSSAAGAVSAEGGPRSELGPAAS